MSEYIFFNCDNLDREYDNQLKKNKEYIIIKHVRIIYHTSNTYRNLKIYIKRISTKVR